MKPLTRRLALPAAALFCAASLPLLSQAQVVGETESATSARPQVVVVNQRPLRTFRGEFVRVGRGTSDNLSIGVVRPRVYFDERYSFRDSFSRLNRADRSDRWARGLTRRVVLDAYRDLSPFYQRSIGVVRPFYTQSPAIRNLPKTVTNPNAAKPTTVGPTFSAQATDAAVYAVRNNVSLPDGLQTDPWALLNAGFYREARTQFDQAAADDSDNTQRTGRALALALAGQLDQAAALMPAAPTLPLDIEFRPATLQRIEQTRAFLYADNPAMQAAFQAILDTVRPAENAAQ